MINKTSKDMAIVEKDKHIAELIIVGKIKADIFITSYLEDVNRVVSIFVISTAVISGMLRTKS